MPPLFAGAPRWGKPHRVLIPFYIAFLLIGSYVFFAVQSGQSLARDMRMIAMSFDPGDLRSLRGLPEDESSPGYRRLRLALEGALKIDGNFKYAYLFGIRAGEEIAFVCTSAAPGTPQTRPGTVLGASEPREDRFFAGESGHIVFKPYRDPWGHWVSVAVPALIDEGTGAVRLAFGIDVAYSGWIKRVVGATALVVLVATIIVALAMLLIDRTAKLRRSLEKLAEEERVMKESAEASERAERDFLALMSHEIRNPLSAIIGFSRLLSESRLDGEQRAQVEMLRYSSDHLMDLVNDILDFSKIQAGKMDILPKPFSPSRLASEVAALFSLEAAKKGIDLELRDERSCPAQVLGDELRVRQILVNLVSNAIKFTERGRVEIGLAYVRADGPDGGLIFRVKDSGPGMDAQALARLFMPFRQGEQASRSGGTGLGLVITRKLVDLMGGEISVGSDLGKGSVFSIRLPLPACEASAEVLLELESPLDGLRILVADDDAANRALVSSLLARRGAEVRSASDGGEALAALLAAMPSGGIDAAVLDRSMPGYTGCEVARRLRAAEATAGRPRLRMIALTASVSAEERDELLQAGFDAVLPKPFDPDRLTLALMPREPLVDEAALLKRAEGDTELASALRLSFEETLRASTAAARAALDAGNLAEARAAAHKLRGSALNACAARVATLAAELEAASASGAPGRASAALGGLELFSR